MIANDRDDIIEDNNLPDTGQAPGLRIVDPVDSTAEFRAQRQGRKPDAGGRTSIPYCSLPFTLSGVSYRFRDWPTSLKLLIAFSGGSLGAATPAV